MWSKHPGLIFQFTSVFPSELLWPAECVSASPACLPGFQRVLQPPPPSTPPGGLDVWRVHIRSTAGWSRSERQTNCFTTAGNKCLFFFGSSPDRVYSPSHQLSNAGFDVFNGQLVPQEQAGQDTRILLWRAGLLTQAPVDVLDAAIR